MFLSRSSTCICLALMSTCGDTAASSPAVLSSLARIFRSSNMCLATKTCGLESVNHRQSLGTTGQCHPHPSNISIKFQRSQSLNTLLCTSEYACTSTSSALGKR